MNKHHMNYLRFIFFMVLLLGLAGCQNHLEESLEEQAVTVSYQSSLENFPNPERGFFIQKVGWDRVIHPDWESFTLEDMRQARRQGITLARVYYLITEFKGTSLSQEFLTKLTQDFNNARTAGFKLIPLFSYNWPSADFDQHPERSENQDAPVADVLRHIDQLKSVMQKNVDVIAMWDAGFIGAWGEWHTSTNNLIGSTIGSEVNSNTRQIVAKLLEVVPSKRAITIRTPRYKQQLAGATALSSTQAYQNTAKARLGAKDDCFLASKSNWGTYLPDDDASVQSYKDFLHQENLFLPQQGETCNAAADAQPYIPCPNALTELAYMRFSALNINYEQNVLQGWRNGGCFNEIARRLGYRFRLTKATLPTTAKLGSSQNLSLTMTNDGFARPYNPRLVEIVLRNQSTKQDTRLRVTPSQDVRLWLPGPGETKTLSLPIKLPVTLATGTYDIFLNLPDPEPLLYKRAVYSIRLANATIWDGVAGFNKLGTLTVN
jgi:Domain of unknown function (DUF4832)/Domain of unknown function (DUF4874)